MLYLALFTCNLRYIALLCSSNCSQNHLKIAIKLFHQKSKTASKNMIQDSADL